MPNIPLERDQFWFRSTLFQVEPGEDAETNPGCYGRALARWLAASLRAEGVIVDEVFPEDWGWCVLLKKQPFRLWLGCGNATGHEERRPHDAPSDAKDFVWTCIATAEVPFLRRLFFAPDTRLEVVDLFKRIKRLVAEAPGTTFVDEP